jgi:hypothetical protein
MVQLLVDHFAAMRRFRATGDQSLFNIDEESDHNGGNTPLLLSMKSPSTDNIDHRLAAEKQATAEKITKPLFEYF